MTNRRTTAPPQEKASLLAGILRDAQLIWRLMGDPRVATLAKVMVPALTVLYILSPVDFLPDMIPILGQMDDLAILALAAKLFIHLAPPQVVSEYRNGVSHGETGSRQPADGETVDADYRIIK